MKLPNSYGSVFKLKGTRRNPWVARKTVGWKLTDNGKAFPEYLYVGYFKTKVEAMQALAEYNGNPYTKEAQYVTFAEVYEQFTKERFPKLKTASISNYTQAYSKMSDIYDIPIRTLKLEEVQSVIDDIETLPQQKKAQMLISVVYDFALKQGILPQNTKKISSYIELNGSKSDRQKQPFTEEMIADLWANPCFDSKLAILLCYTGVRIMELLNLKCENIHLPERYFDVVESKTEAGIRKVPICDKILPIFEEFFGDEYLIHTERTHHFTYQAFLTHWHYEGFTPHCCRLTFISRCVQKGIDQRVIKKIVGHTGDMTENVYTRLSIETLLDAVNQL